MQRLVEIRSYQLKPGTTAEFHAAVQSAALPMLRDWGADVVAYGPSPHAPDTYFLIRAYVDLDDMNRRQVAFYGSEEWRNGPREGIVSRIESYLSTVLWMSPEAIEDLRRRNLR
jgi:NIPSNAP